MQAYQPALTRWQPAGGAGELSFELVNLNRIPSTVVDPRPSLKLDRQLGWLQACMICFVSCEHAMNVGDCNSTRRLASTSATRCSKSLWTASMQTFWATAAQLCQITCAWSCRIH